MVYDQIKSVEVELAAKGTADKFLHRLRDTIDKLEIDSDFTITHRDYEPLEVPIHHREHLKKISAAERDRYLTINLKNYLFDIFCGVIKPKVNNQLKLEVSTQPMANYVSKWSETLFYQRLLEHNQSQGYSDPDWLAIAKESDNRWQIKKNGLTLYIKPEKYLVNSSDKLESGQMVSVKMPPNLVDHDFFIAVGNAGQPTDLNQPIVQLYFNVDSEGALLLLSAFSQQLNLVNMPFNFKIAYDTDDFDYFDAAILEFNRDDFSQLHSILAGIYPAHQHYFQAEIPFFCKQLAPGLGLSEKPLSNLDHSAVNIGQKHCEIIAKAFLELHNQNTNSKERILDNMIDYLSAREGEFKYLYLNPSSADIYSIL